MISKKQYVNRLEKMLKVDQPCETCPGLKGFNSMELKLGYLPLWQVNKVAYPDDYICQMCFDFIDLPVEEFGSCCPCKYFKRNRTALKRAHKAIIAYKNGTHRWCKEGLR